MSNPHKITANSPARAKEVFGTAELMENIMLNLGARDVLKAMQATRAMRDTVLGSTKIQTSIGLLPGYDCHFSVVPWETIGEQKGFVEDPRHHHHSSNARAIRFHGFTLSNYYNTFHSAYDRRHPERLEAEWFGGRHPSNGGKADFMIVATGDDKCFYKLGPRVRALSICQPPAKFAYFAVLCEECESQWHQRRKEPHLEENRIRNADYLANRSGPVNIANGRYVTIGDLYKANIQARQRHRKGCSQGRGKMFVEVGFYASVRLRDDDPISIFRQREDVARDVHDWSGEI